MGGPLAGVSVPVGGRVRVRVGQSRGHYVQGTETPTIIDTGTVTFTTQRIVFLGERWTREWNFAHLLGIQHFTNQPWTAIQVANRQKTSGFTYQGLRPDLVHAASTWPSSCTRDTPTRRAPSWCSSSANWLRRPAPTPEEPSGPSSAPSRRGPPRWATDRGASTRGAGGTDHAGPGTPRTEVRNRGHSGVVWRTTKYLAWGWWQMMAAVVCSGWNCHDDSSSTSTPMRSAPTSSAHLALSSRSGHAG